MKLGDFETKDNNLRQDRFANISFVVIRMLSTNALAVANITLVDRRVIFECSPEEVVVRWEVQCRVKLGTLRCVL